MSTANPAIGYPTEGSFEWFDVTTRFFKRMKTDLNMLSCSSSKTLCDFQEQAESMRDSLKDWSDIEGLLSRSSELEELLAIARQAISTEIAERLTVMRDQPFNPEEGEEPLNIESTRSFLLFCLRRGIEHRPIITATPHGLVQADWRGGKSNRVTVRFFPESKVWFSIRTPSLRKTSELPLKEFWESQSLPPFPELE